MRNLSQSFDIDWDVKPDSSGLLSKNSRWNLTQLSNATPPPNVWLADVGEYETILSFLNQLDPNRESEKKSLSLHWQDFIKAVVLDKLLITKIKATSIMNSVVPPLRILATVNEGIEPWAISAEHFIKTYEIIKKWKPESILADWLIKTARDNFDLNFISTFGTIANQLEHLKRTNQRADKKTKAFKEKTFLDELEQRKTSNKLPEKKAFWELVRIVFTEEPKTFVDAVRFAQIRVMFICGLRVGEIARLPVNYKHYVDLIDQSKNSNLHIYGAVDRVLWLKYFAEKQKKGNNIGGFLHEEIQAVPQIFEQILCETLDQIVKLTTPLRETLRAQFYTGKIFPTFDQRLVSVVDAYSYLSGNAVFLSGFEKDIENIKKFTVFNRQQQLDELYSKQRKDYLTKFRFNFYVYMNRLKGKIKFYDRDARLVDENSISWWGAYFNVRELEAYLKTNVTKLSDVNTFKTNVGVYAPYNFLFLVPKRVLSEQRNEGLFNPKLTYSIGISDPQMLTNYLSQSSSSTPSIFEVYGKTDEDRKLSLPPHALRHLQNTELF